MRRFSQLFTKSISSTFPLARQIKNFSIIPPINTENKFNSIRYSLISTQLISNINEFTNRAIKANDNQNLIMANKLLACHYSLLKLRPTTISNNQDHYQDQVKMEDGSRLNLIIKTVTAEDLRKDKNLILGSIIFAINSQNEMVGTAFIEHGRDTKKGCLHILRSENNQNNSSEINKIMLKNFAIYYDQNFSINDHKNEDYNDFVIAISPFCSKDFQDATNINVDPKTFISYINISCAISCADDLQRDEEDIMQILKQEFIGADGINLEDQNRLIDQPNSSSVAQHKSDYLANHNQNINPFIK